MRIKNLALGKLSVWRHFFVAVLFFAAAIIGSSAQTVTTLLNFTGANGGQPSGLVQGVDGSFYGTTDLGGANCESVAFGCGTAFRITPAGILTTLYSFCVQGYPDCFDGSYPSTGVIPAGDGVYYGTTTGGGVFNTTGYYDNLGTVFKIDSAGNYTQLASFAGYPTNGSSPGNLVQASDGNFYGVTSAGGLYCSPGGCGTVFKITPSGTLTTLHNFCADLNACPDGSGPTGLMQAADGELYGTTSSGGINDDPCGTVFKINAAGTLISLHSFRLVAEGCEPSPLTQANDGNFYGTTRTGGAHNSGTIFKMTPTGKVTNLYSFCAQTDCTDGDSPNAGLIQATDGNLYGTTGGTYYKTQDSVIFRITTSGTFTQFYTFNKYTQHAASSRLVQATNGNFLGATGNGSCSDSKCGTVFNFSDGLGPFVEARPNFGAAGRIISILGDNLARTSSVTFNGTPATFTVLSNTLIHAKVPTGATTGTIQVTTAGETLSSNAAFRVAP